MLDLIRSVLPTKWNSNDQLVIFGICSATNRGFTIRINQSETLFATGRKLVKTSALDVFCHYGWHQPAVSEYVGVDNIPGKPGQYHFVYSEVDHVGYNSIDFTLDGNLQIGSFGPVRTNFIRWELIRRGYIKLDSVYFT